MKLAEIEVSLCLTFLTERYNRNIHTKMKYIIDWWKAGPGLWASKRQEEYRCRKWWPKHRVMENEFTRDRFWQVHWQQRWLKFCTSKRFFMAFVANLQTLLNRAASNKQPDSLVHFSSRKEETNPCKLKGIISKEEIVWFYSFPWLP